MNTIKSRRIGFALWRLQWINSLNQNICLFCRARIRAGKTLWLINSDILLVRQRAILARNIQYLLNQRIERAKQLLKQTDQSIMDIALLCGFNSHSHLAKQFRQLTGMTPKTYRTLKWDRNRLLGLNQLRNWRSIQKLSEDVSPKILCLLGVAFYLYWDDRKSTHLPLMPIWIDNTTHGGKRR